MTEKMRKFILGDAWPVADLVARYIKLQPDVTNVAIVGEIRRGLEIVSAIEIVAATSSSATFLRMLKEMPGVEDGIVNADGPNLFLNLVSGPSCIIYVVQPEHFITALHYYTGSAEYIAKLTQQAEAQGFKLTPEGLKNQAGQVISIKAENDIYSALKRSYIEPELREDDRLLGTAGEIGPLVAFADIRGVFHVHTTYSDGAGSLLDMAEGAKARGWSYLGIADHSKTAMYARGLRVETVLAQRREIEKINETYLDFRILAGIESDILPDGSLDYPENVLASFDFVIASVHSSFRQSENDMTRRIIRAVNNRYVTMLGHPTGRILLGRKGYAVNLPEVIKACAQTSTMIEINSSPYRLDLDWRWCIKAKEQGILFAINPDAHAVNELEYVRYGLASARKAGLTAADILSTRDLNQAIKLIKRKQS